MSTSSVKKHYDLQKKNKAVTAFGFRILVCGYLLYLAWNIAQGAVQNGSVPRQAAFPIALLFGGVAVWFVWYAFGQYRTALHKAECTEAEMQAERAAAVQQETAEYKEESE